MFSSMKLTQVAITYPESLQPSKQKSSYFSVEMWVHCDGGIEINLNRLEDT